MENMEKIRVLDISTVVAGPFAAAILADFGAEVIKVEMPGVGDSSRVMAPIHDGIGLRWAHLGRNKKTITLDFHQPEAIELFLKLVEKSDIIIENFRTGTLAKWGLDIDTLRKANPNIIVTHITGYGQTGPNRYKSGFGNAITGYAGLTYISGYPDRPPVNPSISLCDYLTGLFAVIGSLIAVINQKSQEIDCSLYESMFRLQEVLISRYYTNGEIVERGMRIGSVPNGLYFTKDKKWVNIACSSDRTFAYLTKAMGRPDLLEKYPKQADRFPKKDELVGITGDWVASLTLSELLDICDREKIVASPLFTIEDIFHDEHYKARNEIQIVSDEKLGTVAMPAVTPRLSETPGQIKWTGRELGAYNDEIFGELIGLSQEVLADYKARKII